MTGPVGLVGGALQVQGRAQVAIQRLRSTLVGHAARVTPAPRKARSSSACSLQGQRLGAPEVAVRWAIPSAGRSARSSVSNCAMTASGGRVRVHLLLRSLEMHPLQGEPRHLAYQSASGEAIKAE